MNQAHEIDHTAMLRAKEEGSLKIQRRHYSDGSEKLPNKASGWRSARDFDPRTLPDALSVSAWTRRGVYMITSLENAHAPDGSKDVIPQWHVSISTRIGGHVRRATDDECRQALACIGLVGAEEDNHHPGIARHFWMPKDPKRRVECECKVTETVVTDPDGYRWSNSTDEASCHGCEYEATMEGVGVSTPCPIHRGAKRSVGDHLTAARNGDER